MKTECGHEKSSIIRKSGYSDIMKIAYSSITVRDIKCLGNSVDIKKYPLFRGYFQA
jgi:hypothetical protein